MDKKDRKKVLPPSSYIQQNKTVTPSNSEYSKFINWAKKGQKKVAIDQINQLSNEKILTLHKDRNDISQYYLNDKLISKEAFYEIKPAQIASLHVVKNNGETKMYATSRK